MKRTNTISALLAFTTGVVMTTFAVAGEAEAKCVQSGLNALGYEAGTVDGQIGKGTQRAFEKYKTAAQAPNIPLINPTMAGWCLYLAYNEKSDDATLALAAPVAAATTIKILIGINETEAITKVYLKDGQDAVVGEVTSLERMTRDGASLVVASFPYDDVKSARVICADFGNGWAVLDAQGVSYEASCDPQPIAFWTGELRMGYSVSKKP